ncbi:hypothetical protein L218DRAFT_950233 [Marasmius fiardii PR-910]|nr:hypothetical protein L218DRAFT_950233 [Marasmius fiardii PR-910]
MAEKFSEIPSTAIAATRRSSDPLLVYFQDSMDGIRDFAWNGRQWSGGTTFCVRFQAKHHSPLAVVEWKEASRRCIRVYVIGNDSSIIERGHNGDGNWFNSSNLASIFSDSNLKTFNGSGLAAFACDEHRRLYYQKQDSLIQELIYTSHGWIVGEVIDTSFISIGGSTLASVGWVEADKPYIRVYYFGDSDEGDDSRVLWEASNYGGAWKSENTKIKVNSSPGIAAIAWRDHEVHIRLYCVSPSYQIQEWCKDGARAGSWTKGSLTDKNIKASPYTKLSAVRFDSKIHLFMQLKSGDLQEWKYDPRSQWVSGETLAVESL